MNSDQQVRAVAEPNLRAMCKRVSGVCHRFQVEKLTQNRAYVTYSNPDEYGNERPMTAVFPVMRRFDATPEIILVFLAVRHDTWDGEGWQAFHPLIDCPTLWRDPQDGSWRTEEEIKAANTAIQPWQEA